MPKPPRTRRPVGKSPDDGLATKTTWVIPTARKRGCVAQVQTEPAVEPATELPMETTWVIPTATRRGCIAKVETK